MNAANVNLQDGGGVAKQFVDCGGPQIQVRCKARALSQRAALTPKRQAEANSIIQKNGPLFVAQTAVQGTGCLPYGAHIINVVGPQWDASVSRIQPASIVNINSKLCRCVFRNRKNRKNC